MPDFTIRSLRGGMNNTDPAIGLAEDQCVLAQNVEFVESLLGERRKGTSAVTLPAFLSAHDKITFLHRHLPTDEDGAAELWALGVTGTSSASLGYKTGSWQAEVTIPDTPTLSGDKPFRWQGQTLHGKLFLAYKSAVDRLHVWNGTSVRRVGLAAPGAAPTSADAGSGSLTGTRYGRVRFVEIDGSTVVRRGEPSAVKTHSPSGSGASITWTKPADISEGETHWEIELSVDNVNFYRMARIVVGTSTHSDTVDYASGYATQTDAVLSEDIGDYALIPSPRYLTADEDRLIWAGSWEDSDLGSRVGWTPVFGADGAGNDERFETDTDPYKDLDTYEGGIITGLSSPVLGAVWVFKTRGIYKLVRTGRRTNAYNVIKYSDALGAVHGSVVTGFTADGQPCVYFIDPVQGPCRAGLGGILRCGDDVRATWETLNLNATDVVCSSLYYPAKRQVHWNLAVSSGDTPTTRLVLHVDRSVTLPDGVRRGYALWTGNVAKALCMCLFADNIEANTTRSLRLVPFIGLEGLGYVHLCDTGYQDNSVAYTATITTKPYALGNLQHEFEVTSGTLLATEDDSAQVTVKVLRDFALETTATVSDIALAGAGSETQVIKYLDNLIGAEMKVAQFQMTDVAAPAANWAVNQLSLTGELGQRG